MTFNHLNSNRFIAIFRGNVDGISGTALIGLARQGKDDWAPALVWDDEEFGWDTASYNLVLSLSSNGIIPDIWKGFSGTTSYGSALQKLMTNMGCPPRCRCHADEGGWDCMCFEDYC